MSPGYLRNYLVPRKLAQPATKGALEEAGAQARGIREGRPRGSSSARADRCAALQDRADDRPRAGEDGKLFGSVTSKEIADAIAEARGLRHREKKRIRLEDPIRSIGTYMVEVEVAGGATATVKTIVAEQK